MRLEGQVAIVTGGGGGIGKATCLAFAREGANVVIPEVNIANAAAVSAEITALGRQCLVIETDVADGDSVRGMVQQTLGTFGRIDIFSQQRRYFQLYPYRRMYRSGMGSDDGSKSQGALPLFSGSDGNDESTTFWTDYQSRFVGRTGWWIGRVCPVFCLKSRRDVPDKIVGACAWRVRHHG